MTYHEKAQDIYNHLAQGKLLEAFDKYYDENVVMVEADGRKREGKATNRAYEEQFLGMVQDWHGMGVDAVTADEANKVTTVESWMDVTFKDGNRQTLKQVAVQRWEGDFIVEERFFSGAA